MKLQEVYDALVEGPGTTVDTDTEVAVVFKTMTDERPVKLGKIQDVRASSGNDGKPVLTIIAKEDS